MASPPGNRHCANCIGAVSLPIAVGRVHRSWSLVCDVLQLLGLLVTYFLLVVQITSSFQDSAAAGYDVTTAAMATTAAETNW